MAAPGASGPGSAANPRKFSEKIALQRQRQAAETAAFEEVMMDIGSTRLQVQKLRMAHMRGPYYGGSLPNVNQISCGSGEFQGPSQSPLDPSRSMRRHGLVERAHRDPRRMMSPLRRYMRQMDSSPYNVSYLSPQQDASVRRNLPWGNHPSDTGQLFRLPSALNRTNSDSALHTSVMEPYPVLPQGVSTPTRRSGFPFPIPGIDENQADGGHLLKPCDTKKLPSSSARPKSCEVPGINIYPSVDQPPSVPPVASVLNTGGSLPDLTNLHFPSPLPTPLDPEESGYSGLSGGSSTGNLASTMNHLGISRIGVPPGFDATGFPSTAAMQNSISRQTLQSSLSNPNLQSSLSSASLQTSFSNQSLQSSLSSQSLPSSLSNQSLSPSVSSHSLASGYSTPTSPSSSSSSSFPPLASTSPRRRVPLSPLTLPMAGDSRRSHQKQFSPTMSPTLTSITQGVPLDTSKMPADQRLPPYHFTHPSVFPQSQLHQSQPSAQESPQPLHQSPQPVHQHHQPLLDVSQNPLHHFSSKDHHDVPPGSQSFPYQQNSEGPPYQYLLGDCNSLLSSLFDECDLQISAHRAGSLSQQFEQCNMVEDGRLALSGGSFPGDYSHIHITGLSGSGGTSQSYRKQNNRHDPIPNIILTAVDSPPGFSKEITSALSCVPGFEMEQSLGLEEDLNIEPLTLDGLNMLSDPYAPLTDPLVEDSFRCDRLQ